MKQVLSQSRGPWLVALLLAILPLLATGEEGRQSQTYTLVWFHSSRQASWRGSGCRSCGRWVNAPASISVPHGAGHPGVRAAARGGRI